MSVLSLYYLVNLILQIKTGPWVRLDYLDTTDRCLFAHVQVWQAFPGFTVADHPWKH
jgi:hypothetical protein